MASHKVPAMKRAVLEEDGTHLTIRVERASGRRTIEHVPARFLDFEWFAERAIPVRRSANYRKRRNRIGHLWMASTRTSVQFESLLERSLLLDLDYVSAYRNLGDADPLIEQVLSISSDLGPVGVGELAATVPGGFIAAMPVVLHLAWHHRLEINLDEPLSATTSVRVPRTNRPALKVAA